MRVDATQLSHALVARVDAQAAEAQQLREHITLLTAELSSSRQALLDGDKRVRELEGTVSLLLARLAIETHRECMDDDESASSPLPHSVQPPPLLPSTPPSPLPPSPD